MQAPWILYGTAWKEERTADCVARALAMGFRGIDTANQRKHYHEAGVGAALATCGIPRAELWLQTKFTFRDGQDDRLPYDAHAPVAAQVEQSFRSSREHLGVERLDSLVLHGPSQRDGLGDADREAWRAMEELAQAGLVGALGISNVTARQVAELASVARVAPAFVQNRCYAERGWDRDVRAACRARGIVYQGFSLLTANRAVVGGPVVARIAREHHATPAQVIFAFARQVGMLPLTGTTDSEHMSQDVAASGVDLTARELETIAVLGEKVR